jgi:hypothetical protein
MSLLSTATPPAPLQLITAEFPKGGQHLMMCPDAKVEVRRLPKIPRWPRRSARLDIKVAVFDPVLFVLLNKLRNE